jgi:hypothetical protein
LLNVEDGATANDSDANLKARANHTGTQTASTISDLATVATSGSYNDLSNQPTIPTNNNQLTNGANYITDANVASNSAVVANTAKISYTDAAAVAANTAKVTNATHTGDATGATALTLATVNSNVGQFTNADITVNAKGLITAAANGSGGAEIHAFSSGSITQEGSYTLNYPSAWTGGTPDKVLVSTRYPAGNGSSQTWFQVKSFGTSSVTVFAQTQNYMSGSFFGVVIADILLVKN